jgi:hypothetical protein
MNRPHDINTNKLLEYVLVNFKSPTLDINCDLVNWENCEKEKIYINGQERCAYPDLKAINEFKSPKIYILGEAKTSVDYKQGSLRAYNQMDVYINVLKKKQYPVLIYAVPMGIKDKVKHDIKSRINLFDAHNIFWEVIY